MATAAAVVAGVAATPSGSWRMMWWLLAGVLGLATAFVVFFFRDPRRTCSLGPDGVLAPADGRIVQIIELEEPHFLRGAATRISIFLSIFNVHIQRAPLSGVVEHREYRPGRYLAAWNPKASDENEQASLGITGGPNRVLVRQIAGLVARRVVTDPSEGDRVERGSRIGIIRFGSRVDLFLPRTWEITCAVGDVARAGTTVLAKLPAPVDSPAPFVEPGQRPEVRP